MTEAPSDPSSGEMTNHPNHPDPLDKQVPPIGALGVVVVDHGSRRDESNRMLESFVAEFAAASTFSIVEPAHMELAEPSIATAFARCVERGARRVMVVPYFLLPGRHWNQDIPDLTRAAGADHPEIPWCVSAPIGLHPLMHQVIGSRVQGCLEQIAGRQDECEVCQGTGRCRFQVTAGTEVSP